MKKVLFLSLLLLQACTAFAPTPIESLTVAISPNISIEVFNQVDKDFEKELKAQLREEGYDVQKLELIRATSNHQAGEMVISGLADIAFISKLTYFDLKDQGLMPLLTQLEPSYNLDPSLMDAWNDQTQLDVGKTLQATHRAALYLGSSNYAVELRNKLNTGDQLTWIDLNGAKWCHILVTSLEGYIYPSLWLIENYERRIVELFDHELVVRGYDELMMRVANQECDIIVGPEDIRDQYASKWSSEGYDRSSSIYSELELFALTAAIPHDVVVYLEGQAKYDEVFVQDLQSVLMNLASSDVKNPLFEQMQIKGLIETSPEQFDDYAKAYDYLQEIFN
jgi:phosphonate transport system substrate-binding protein